MARVLAITNRKGGSGKTTSAVNIAAALAHRGNRVMLIDADPQAHATVSLGYRHRGADRGLHRVLTSGTPIEGQLADTYHDRLKLLPGSPALREYQRAHSADRKALPVLKTSIDAIADRWEYIVFDTPPTLGLLTLSALLASSEVYVPMQTHFLCLEGLAELVTVIRKVQTLHRPDLTLKGVIPTFYRDNTRLTHGILEEIRRTLGEVIMHPIRVNVSLAEAPGFGQSIFQYDLKSNGAADYLAVAQEIEHGTR